MLDPEEASVWSAQEILERGYRYRWAPVPTPSVPTEQPNPLAGLARAVVAWELLQEAWAHEKAKARAAMMGA